MSQGVCICGYRTSPGDDEARVGSSSHNRHRSYIVAYRHTLVGEAFPSLENIEIIEQGILWVGSGRQMEEMRILLHMMSRIPSIRCLRSPFVDLVETASEWPPDEAMAAIPHIDSLTVTEPWLVPKENRYWLYRLFPNLMTHTEIWSGPDDFRSGFRYGRERLRF